MRTTFESNGRRLPFVPVILPGLSRSFAATRQDAWTKMLTEAERTDIAPANFVEVVDRVRAFANRAFAPPAPRKESQLKRDSPAAPAPPAPAYA